MKKQITLLLAALLAISLCACEPQAQEESTTTSTPETTSESATTTELPITEDTCTDGPVARKPVIYLYPTEDTLVSLKLDLNGKLTAAYPAYNNGWTVHASPDGTLTDLITGRTYYCLYWEGISNAEYDLSKGFVVPGADTAAFLEDTLAKLGLTEREANEFIIYWLPYMEGNAYNLITFQTDAYTDNAPLTVTPAPDSMLRVFMAWKPLDKPVDIAPQELPTFERHGFAVIEWGGTELN